MTLRPGTPPQDRTQPPTASPTVARSGGSSTASSQIASQTIGAPRATVKRSRQVRPTHGARSTANHAVRSPRCNSAPDEHDHIAHRGAILQRFNVHGPKTMPRLRRLCRDLARMAFSRAPISTMRHSGCRRRRSLDQVGDRHASAPRVANPERRCRVRGRLGLHAGYRSADTRSRLDPDRPRAAGCVRSRR